ncbi:MAG: response regulator [Bacteroidota bacterium]
MEHRLIFFVDDEKAILNLLEYTFSSRDGYEVKTFSSGEECVANLERNPDLIVLDHMLWPRNESNWSGLDVLKKVRELGHDIPVIVLSGTQEPDLIDDYYANGATKYIIKNSFFIDTLIETIKQQFLVKTTQ